MVIRVRFFSPFCSSGEMKKIICESYTFDPEKIIVVDDDNYTHVVIINNAMPELQVPPERVLGLAWEPPEPPPFLGVTPEFIEWCKKRVGRYYIGQKGNLPHPFMEHYSYLNYCPAKEIHQKTRLMSIIFSGKNALFGHQYRNKLVMACLNSGFPVDVWGRGCGLIKHDGDPRIKGEFSGNEPYRDYLFSIAVENCSLNDYITEKFTQCLINKTVPIYYGGKNVDKWFPNSSIVLTGDLGVDMMLIKSILLEPQKWLSEIKFANIPNLGDHLVKIWS